MISRKMVSINIALMGCVALAGCDTGTNNEENAATSEANSSVAPPPPAATQPIEMPPMVARSASYRCDDGKALYVDVLTDENRVNVRDTRADAPSQLSREAASDPFVAADRSLSGVGDVVRYQAPDRPEQECRSAPD